MQVSQGGAEKRAQVEVVLGALAFAASVPLGKALVAGVAPRACAGVLYLAAGLALSLALLCRARASHPPAAVRATPHGATAPRPTIPSGNTLRGWEWAWLAGAVLSGGVLAPVALFAGLTRLQGHIAGLLLNLESVFTIALAMALYRERLGKRGWAGAVAVVLGGALLALAASSEGESPPTQIPGILLLACACALWALDNNLTQRVSGRDARQIVAIKGLVGGTTNLVVAAVHGELGGWTGPKLAGASVVGVVCYGLSIVLFVRGLRQLGVARTGMLFALVPGFAAVLSWVFLREPVHVMAVLSLALMSGGSLAVATDRHEHLHRHAAFDHEHAHEHDEHHQHAHAPEELARTPHSHAHHHEPVEHAHPHAHDLHHRHPH